MAFKLTLACLVIAAVLTGEAARRPGSYHKRRIPEGNDNPLRNRVKDAEYHWEEFLQRRACIALGSTGCEANNGKCCRAGNPYTGTMRKCVNTGSFASPVYTCKEQ